MENFKKLAEELIPKLEMRKFEAYYCENADTAKEKALSLINKDDTLSWGGSRTLAEIGLIDTLRRDGYTLVDRDTAKSPEEKFEFMRKALLCDTYLTSTNAVTKDGILVNVDGNGNRVAAMCFGPKNVIVIVGMNKLCDTLEDAEERVHNVAAPLNAKRFGFTKTGCSTGKCCECLSDECMCSYTVKTRQSKTKGRIKIILVGESLGF